jgi:FkbM family methyltransferase
MHHYITKYIYDIMVIANKAMTKQEIKFFTKRYMPEIFFDILNYSYRNIIIKPVSAMNQSKLKNFTKETVIDFDFVGAKFKIILNPKNGTVDNEIFLQGVYEPSFLKVVKENLKAGDTYIDIGANIGQHSLFASRIVGESGKVIAFEPVYKIYSQFQRSVQLNSIQNIKIHNLACGEKEREMFIYMTESNMGGSSLVFGSENREKEKIHVVTADSILKPEPTVNFIKIDVEGYEYEAMLGLIETLETHHPKIMLEYSYGGYRETGLSNDKKILDLLFALDYSLYDIENNDKEIPKLKNSFDYAYFEDNKIIQTNLLCK